MKAIDSKHGKKTRAEPVAMRVEQHRIHMVGRHEELEKQCAEFVPDSGGDLPDRMDAFVHVCRHFMAAEKKAMRMASPADAMAAAMAAAQLGGGIASAVDLSGYGRSDGAGFDYVPSGWDDRYGG